MKTIFLLLPLLFLEHAIAQVTWSDAVSVAPSHYGNLHPRVVVNRSGNPVIIWTRASDQGLYCSRWDGVAFTTPARLNPPWLTVAGASWMGPDIAARGDTIYVVMKRTPEGADTNHVYITRSPDGGATFSPPRRVTFIADSLSRFPTVAVDDMGNPVVGFMKFNPAFGDSRWVVTRSTDQGASFSPDDKASGWSGKFSTVCDCCPGAISSSGNRVAMMYRDNQSNIRDSWAGLSTDGGATFSVGWNMDQQRWGISSCPATGPDGVIIGDELHAVFMSAASGRERIYRGISFLDIASAPLSQSITGSVSGLSTQNYPRIDAFGNAAAIVWVQTVNGIRQLPVVFASDARAGFPGAYEIVATGNVPNADVALSDRMIHVVWQDDATGSVRFRSGRYAIASDIARMDGDPRLDVALFPNPATSYISIRVRPGDRIRSVLMFDMLGRECRRSSVRDGSLSVDVSGLDSGMYQVMLRTEGNDLVRRTMFVVK